MPFRVFVKFSSNKSTVIDGCRPDMTTGEFRQKIMDKEGLQVQSLRLIYAGKQLDEEYDNKRTLADYNIKRNSAIFSVLRLLGGAMPAHMPAKPKERGPGAVHRFDENKVRTLRNVNIGGGQVVNIQVKKTSANIKCRIGAYCSGNDPIVVFHDDDRVCAECMAHYTRNEILNGKPFIKCPGAKDQNESHPCQKEIPFHVAAAVCGLTKQEREDWEFWLNSNALGMKVCPNAACRRYIVRMDKVMRVQCPDCKDGEFCWLCLNKWKGDGYLHCGNANCSEAAMTVLQLEESWNERTNHGKLIGRNKDFPLQRVCPNTGCSVVNEYGDKCKHITCSKCTHQYCHICLKKWSGCKCGYCQYIGDGAPVCSGYYDECNLAGLQTQW